MFTKTFQIPKNKEFTKTIISIHRNSTGQKWKNDSLSPPYIFAPIRLARARQKTGMRETPPIFCIHLKGSFRCQDHRQSHLGLWYFSSSSANWYTQVQVHVYIEPQKKNNWSLGYLMYFSQVCVNTQQTVPFCSV